MKLFSFKKNRSAGTERIGRGLHADPDRFVYLGAGYGLLSDPGTADQRDKTSTVFSAVRDFPSGRHLWAKISSASLKINMGLPHGNGALGQQGGGCDAGNLTVPVSRPHATPSPQCPTPLS